MAKIWQISDGRSYVVNGDPGTTITYTNSTSNGTAAGKQAASIPTGATSVIFPSNGAEVEISSDTATIDQVFNAAAAGSGSSSGGSGSEGGVTFQVVTTLPEEGTAGVIYLVKVSETGDDKFEEWIWVDSAWESIGTTAIDPTAYARLVGGNDFTGNQTVQGDVTVNGALTVTGDSSGIVDNNYNLVETADSTITPQAGTWTRYTGSETALTIAEPEWSGEVEISYLETASPVDLQGVTWSPAKPTLTGNGPFVYTLVHAGSGQMLAGAYGYSVATAEAVQAVVPIAWGSYTTAPIATEANSISIGGQAESLSYGVSIGNNAKTGASSVSVGYNAKAQTSSSVAMGGNAYANGSSSVAIGTDSTDGGWTRSVSIGSQATGTSPTTITIGAKFDETVDGQTVPHTCKTQGTGSITIGAGANTLNTTTTVDGVETTVESSNSVTIGCKAENKGADSVVIGAQAKGSALGSLAMGASAKCENANSQAVGNNVWNTGMYSFAGGYNSIVLSNASVALGASTYIQAGNSITIGSSATITNATDEDGTVTQSENTTVIGYGATASAPNAVVMGAGASTKAQYTVTIGVNAQTPYDRTLNNTSGDIAIGNDSYSNGAASVAIGAFAHAEVHGSISIGTHASVTQQEGLAIGRNATVSKHWSTAIGFKANVADQGVIALATRSAIGDNKKTQFYIAGAGTDLANEYYSGEAFMGYTVTDTATGDILACGTRRLSELFPDNSLTQPATTDENGEWVQPKVFHPSDLDLPVEEPTEEPEDVTINIPEPVIPEPEPYTPLPVYPIVEPEVPELDELPTE